MHKNTNSSVSVKGKTSVLRLPLTVTSKFVKGNRGLKKKYESAIHVLSRE